MVATVNGQVDVSSPVLHSLAIKGPYPHVDASAYAGDDLGAKIMNANTRLGSDRGMILVSDPTLPISTAVTLSARHVLSFMPGVFSQSASITLNGHGASIIGSGTDDTEIQNTTAAIPSVSATTGIQGGQIRDLRLSRSVTATAGGNGIDWYSTSDQSLIDNVVITGHYIGARLAQCAFGRFVRSIVAQSVSHGVWMVHNPATAFTAIQWYCDDVFSTFNGGDGFRIEGVTYPGFTVMSVGSLQNCKTYANGGRGVNVVGSPSMVIEAIRIDGGFYGEDGAEEFLFDSYGGSHKIVGPYLELSKTGYPLCKFTANNTSAQVAVATMGGAARDAIDTSAAKILIAGCQITNNGTDAVAGAQAGVHVRAGVAQISANMIGNQSGTTQKYGVYCDVATVSIVDNDLNGNAIAPKGGSVSLLGVLYSGNLPAAQDMYLPTGASAIGINTVSPEGVLHVVGTTGAAAGERTVLTLGNTDFTGGMLTSLVFEGGTDTGSERDTAAIKAKQIGGTTGMVSLHADNAGLQEVFQAYGTGAIGIIDGVTAPATVTGRALLYVDTADGDLKIKFGDGTVKTIVVDT